MIQGNQTQKDRSEIRSSYNRSNGFQKANLPKRVQSAKTRLTKNLGLKFQLEKAKGNSPYLTNTDITQKKRPNTAKPRVLITKNKKGVV